MRIMMLTQFFYPPTIGGEERHVADLSKELAARGHDVSVVTLQQEGYSAFEVSQGVRIYRVQSSLQHMSILFSEGDRPYAPPFPDPGLVRALRAVVRKEQPDIVHAHNWIVHSFTPIKEWSGAKLVVSMHDYGHICVQKRMMHHEKPCSGPGLGKCLECGTHFYGALRGVPATLANFFWGGQQRQVVDMFLPVSQAVVDGVRLDKYGVAYTIIPNFIAETPEMESENKDALLATLPKEEFLLFVGDVTVDKGTKVLIQAYREMKTRVPLVLIGRNFLGEDAQHLPEGVLVMGKWPHDVVMEAWKRCLFGLVPSIAAETFGIVSLEALAQGKPVIATRSGGLRDVVVDGESGLLVPPADVEALKQAMEYLLSDRERLADMGIKARQRAEEFRARNVVTRFEQVYRDLMESSVRSTPALVESSLS